MCRFPSFRVACFRMRQRKTDKVDGSLSCCEPQLGMAEEAFQDVDQCKQFLESQLENVLSMQRRELERCKTYALVHVVPDEPALDSHRSAIQSSSKLIDLFAVVAGVCKAIREETAVRLA